MTAGVACRAPSTEIEAMVARARLGRDVLGDGRQAQNIDVQHLAGALRRFEILAAEIPQPEVQALSGRATA